MSQVSWAAELVNLRPSISGFLPISVVPKVNVLNGMRVRAGQGHGNWTAEPWRRLVWQMWSLTSMRVFFSFFLSGEPHQFDPSFSGPVHRRYVLLWVYMCRTGSCSNITRPQLTELFLQFLGDVSLPARVLLCRKALLIVDGSIHRQQLSLGTDLYQDLGLDHPHTWTSVGLHQSTAAQLSVSGMGFWLQTSWILVLFHQSTVLNVFHVFHVPYLLIMQRDYLLLSFLSSFPLSTHSWELDLRSALLIVVLWTEFSHLSCGPTQEKSLINAVLLNARSFGIMDWTVTLGHVFKIHPRFKQLQQLSGRSLNFYKEPLKPLHNSSM